MTPETPREAGRQETAYESRVEQMAVALHRDCELEWDAIAVADPGRLLTMHSFDAHYGKAHDLVRRIWPGLDAAAPATGLPAAEGLRDAAQQAMEALMRLQLHGVTEHREQVNAAYGALRAALRAADHENDHD